jgi:sugar diacid utilization regulator
VTALLQLFQRTITEAEGRVRGELLDDLLSDRATDPDSLNSRAKRVGVDVSAPHVLVVVRYEAREESHRQRATFWAASHAAVEHGLFTVRAEEIVLLLPGDRPGDQARRVARELGASLGMPATAGAAGPEAALNGLASLYLEAHRCTEAMLALGRTGDGASAAELGFVGLLIGHDHDVSSFLDGTLGAVLSYDERRGTDLVLTLETYFAAGSGLAKTAERLHIHVNTVTQRLDRIGRLLGPGWQEPERALELQLALRLHRLRG